LISLEVPNNEDSDFFIKTTAEILHRAPKSEVIIDLGAHVGGLAVQAVVDFGAKFVLAIEADLRNYDYLLGNIAKNHCEGAIFPVWAAVWDVSFQKLILRAAGNSGQRSLMFDSAKASGFPVSTIAWSDILSLVVRKFKTIDLLKVDVEGAEWKIFNEVQDFQSVKYIDLEMHPMDDLRFYDHLEEGQIVKLTRLLEETGFENLAKNERQFYGGRK